MPLENSGGKPWTLTDRNQVMRAIAVLSKHGLTFAPEIEVEIRLEGLSVDEVRRAAAVLTMSIE